MILSKVGDRCVIKGVKIGDGEPGLSQKSLFFADFGEILKNIIIFAFDYVCCPPKGTD